VIQAIRRWLGLDPVPPTATLWLTDRGTALILPAGVTLTDRARSELRRSLDAWSPGRPLILPWPIHLRDARTRGLDAIRVGVGINPPPLRPTPPPSPPEPPERRK
jgi:hypothetical protein